MCSSDLISGCLLPHQSYSVQIIVWLGFELGSITTSVCEVFIWGSLLLNVYFQYLNQVWYHQARVLTNMWCKGSRDQSGRAQVNYRCQFEVKSLYLGFWISVADIVFKGLLSISYWLMFINRSLTEGKIFRCVLGDPPMSPVNTKPRNWKSKVTKEISRRFRSQGIGPSSRYANDSHSPSSSSREGKSFDTPLELCPMVRYFFL